ncbi:NET1-associated nuclear protein 1 [Dimargaris verticillata]|uniref:NET1-associated nuclear protein 1 n=1 Tax=Dimargaris verticillata TaxID=2761393 RepID=A0A9W8B1H0_9FUNG|nr:NET1-associated nuclear protein 1 [Dimargaris verticillata]
MPSPYPRGKPSRPPAAGRATIHDIVPVPPNFLTQKRDYFHEVNVQPYTQLVYNNFYHKLYAPSENPPGPSDQGLACVQQSGGDIAFNGVQVSTDSRYLVTYKSFIVLVYNVVNAQKVLSFTVPSTITACLIHPTEPNLVYISTRSGHLGLWNFLNGTRLASWNIGFRATKLLQSASAPDTIFAWTMDFDKPYTIGPQWVPTSHRLIRLTFSTESQQPPVQHLVHRSAGLLNVALSPSGRFLGAAEGTFLLLWDTHQLDFAPNGVAPHSRLNTKALISCIAFHPAEGAVAVGMQNGQILVYYVLGNLGQRRPVRSLYHWHSVEVQSLAFTADGSYMCSCGMEGVVVSWQMDTRLKDFLPRLGAPARHIVMAPNQREIVLVLANGSVHILPTLQADARSTIRFTRLHEGMVQSARFSSLSSGLVVHPLTQNLAYGTLFSSIQLYDSFADQACGEIILCDTSRATKDPTTSSQRIQVQHIAFSTDGSWVVINERRGSDENLLFWQYNSATNKYQGPNTCVVAPHRGEMRSMAVQPTESDRSSEAKAPLVVTTGQDNLFKIWHHQTRRKVVSKNNHNGPASQGAKVTVESQYWDCRTAMSYRDYDISTAAFSSDGSVLAVVFYSMITLWDPFTAVRQQVLMSVPTSMPLQSAHFAGPTPYVVAISKCQVTVWNLLTNSIWWTSRVNVVKVAYHPDAAVFAVLVKRTVRNTTGSVLALHIYHASSPVPIAVRTVMASHYILGMAFVTRKLVDPSPAGIAQSQRMFTSTDLRHDPRVLLGDEAVDRQTLAQSSLVTMLASGQLVTYVYDTPDQSDDPVAYHPSVRPITEEAASASTQESASALGRTNVFYDDAHPNLFHGRAKSLFSSLYGALRKPQASQARSGANAILPHFSTKHHAALQANLQRLSLLETPSHLLPGVHDLYKTLATTTLQTIDEVSALQSRDQTSQMATEAMQLEDSALGSQRTVTAMPLQTRSGRYPWVPPSTEASTDSTRALTAVLQESQVSDGRGNASVASLTKPSASLVAYFQSQLKL